jgi:hypothetical protein
MKQYTPQRIQETTAAVLGLDLKRLRNMRAPKHWDHVEGYSRGSLIVQALVSSLCSHLTAGQQANALRRSTDSLLTARKRIDADVKEDADLRADVVSILRSL